MLHHVLVPVLLLLARAMPSLAQTSASEGEVFTIQTSVPQSLPLSLPPVSSDVPQLSILPPRTSDAVTGPEASDSGVMSIPQGETPIPTGSSPGSGSATPTPSTAPSSAPPQQSTNAAAPGQTGSDGAQVLFALVLSGLSVTLGFAWTLL